MAHPQLFCNIPFRKLELVMAHESDNEDVFEVEKIVAARVDEVGFSRF